MKRSIILAGITCFMISCNTNHDTDTHSDTTDHSAHQGESSGTGTAANKMKATMDKMMQQMHTMKYTGNTDVDFATMMTAHHQGAVEMSQIEVNEGKNTELKAFAQNVIDDQNKEISFMQGYTSKTSASTSPDAAQFKEALDQSMMAMMNDSTPIHNDIDKDFAAQMIPHHQSAVDMAKAYLQYGKDTGLRNLCKNIIDSQEKEIDMLKVWLAKNK
jgi:uncharacterized protein (DUF305 family)